MHIYVDVLLVLNYVVNLTLLSVSARVFRLPHSRKRLCLSALAGALGTLWIFVPYISPWIQAAYKCLLTVVVSAIAFGIHPWQRALRGIVATLLSSTVFSGTMLAVEVLFAPSFLYFRDGVIYANIKPMTILLFAGGMYGVLWLLTPLFWGRPQPGTLLPVELEIVAFGKSVSLRVLPDSGNLLQEPFSGLPVMVCASDSLRPLGAIPPQKLRLIPCGTVAGQHILHAFRPDVVRLTAVPPQHSRLLRPLYVALSRVPFPQDHQGVLHPSALSATEPDLSFSRK